MKIIKNQFLEKEFQKSQLKNLRISKFLRATVMSLFVMLTIPSISSNIFGNGDAMAGCIERSAFIGQSVRINNDIANHTAFCGAATPLGCTTLSVKINGIEICNSVPGSTSTTIGTCAAVTNATIRCGGLNSAQCQSGQGEIATKCLWVAEDTDNNKLVDAVCRVYQIATGTAGKAFAAVGVISVGIGFFTGKVSWGLMISVAAGIAVFFGAPSIISVISGSDASNLCSNVGR